MTTAPRMLASLVPLLLLACGTESNELPSAPGPSITAHRSATHWSPWSAPVSVGSPINTSSNETDPALSKDGMSLYFVSDRSGGSGGNDIWVARRSDRDAPWGSPVNLGPTVNGASNETTPTLSRDGHQLFFGSGRLGGFGASDVYASYREDVHDDLGWQAPVNLGPGVNSADVELGAAYFEDDDAGPAQLYFNRGRFPVPGGDIYVSERMADGSWGAAMAVAEVNSSFAERGPSIASDGLQLFFWSNRTGVVHIWVATRKSVLDPWSPPEQVDVSINESGEVEPFIHSHGRTQMLFMVGVVGNQNDLFMSTRSKLKKPQADDEEDDDRRHRRDDRHHRDH